jgi:hypothetical protein
MTASVPPVVPATVPLIGALMTVTGRADLLDISDEWHANLHALIRVLSALPVCGPSGPLVSGEIS